MQSDCQYYKSFLKFLTRNPQPAISQHVFLFSPLTLKRFFVKMEYDEFKSTI